MTANHVLTEGCRQRIEAAVGEVESKTSAEVVCAIATESGRYDRAESIVGLALALAALCAAHGLYVALATEGPGDWGAAPGLSLGWQAAAVVAGFVGGSVIASFIHGIRRLVVRDDEMRDEVERAASHVFTLEAVAATAGRTGLLIYVSLFERRVVVLADQQSRAVLTDEGIEALRDTAVARLRGHRVTEAFVETVQQAGVRLAEALPADRQLDADELSNHVLTFHPRP